jgi:hypothetical protein
MTVTVTRRNKLFNVCLLSRYLVTNLSRLTLQPLSCLLNSFATESPESQLVRVTLRLAVYRQSVGLDDKPLETHDQNFYFQTEHLRL